MMAKREPATGASARTEPDPERRLAFRFGLSAESRAAAYLIAKGYRILARRFKTPVGEIDIVARRRGVLVFVEVKARERLADAAESIGRRQQQRIIAAAEFWLAGHPDDAPATCASTSCWWCRAACRCILQPRSMPRCEARAPRPPRRPGLRTSPRAVLHRQPLTERN
jgi:putative endonuclease